MATANTAGSVQGGGEPVASRPPSTDGDGPFAWLRRLDDAVFAVEQTIVATFLSAMTIMVFLDFVDRRLTAPDSRVGILLARLFGVTDEGTSQWLQHSVAPVVSAVVGLGVLFFGVASARTPRGQKLRVDATAVGLTLVAAAMITGLGLLMSWHAMGTDEFGFERRMRVFPSKYFYILLYCLVAVPWAVNLVRKRPQGWVARLVGLGITGGLLAAFALRYFPNEYSWSKEISLIMLLWVGFLGASICAHEGKHIRMEAASRVVPESLERYVAALGFLVAAFFCAVMAYLGWDYLGTAVELGGVYEQSGVPDYFATLAIPLAFGLTVLRFSAAAVSALRGGTYGATVDDDLAAAQAARAREEAELVEPAPVPRAAPAPERSK